MDNLKHSLLFFGILFTLIATAQTIEVVNTPYSPNHTWKKYTNPNRLLKGQKASSCGVDTLIYSQFKASSDRYITLNAASSASAYGMYFDAPGTITVHGFVYYAYSSFGGSETVQCKLYYAGSTLLPAGAPLASKTQTVGFGFANLPFIRKEVIFDSPVEVTAGYVITLETASTNGIVVVSNDWTNGDGDGKYYACGQFNTGWFKSSSMNIAGVTWDADFYVEPIVSYELEAGFEPSDNSCLGNGNPFEFTNTTTPALSEFYSPAVLGGTNNTNFWWDYDDGSPKENQETGLHSYASIGSYDVELEAIMIGWDVNCRDTFVGNITESNLQAGYSYTKNGLTVSFTDNSVDAETWNYDFDDGQSSSQNSPLHTFPSTGNYSVKQVVTKDGCKDSTTLVVFVDEDAVGIEEQKKESIWSVYPNPANDHIIVSGIQGELVSVQLYSLLGELVLNEQMVNSSSIIDVQDLPIGQYLIKIEGATNIWTDKVNISR